MPANERRRVVWTVAYVSLMDGAFIWLLLQSRYVMRHHFYGEPLPAFSEFVFRTALPQRGVNLVLIAACYALASMAIGLAGVSCAADPVRERRRLIRYLALSRLPVFALTLAYVCACMLPLLMLMVHLDGYHMDLAKERAWTAAAGALAAGLLIAFLWTCYRYLRGERGDRTPEQAKARGAED